MNILVTNANSRMALCVARELNKKGHNVYVADYIAHSMCFYSNKITKQFIYPSPYSEPEHFIKSISEKIKAHNIEMVIPIHEETFLISKNKDILGNSLLLAIPEYKTILDVHNKDKLHNLLQKKSIKTPKTIPLTYFDDFNDIRSEFEGNIVLKPRQGGGNWGIFFPKNDQDYLPQIKDYLKYSKIDINRILVQEWIPIAKKYSHVIIYQNGNFIQDFADIHLRDFPITGGAGVLRASCDASPMTHISRTLFDDLGWHGIAEIEYVTHAETGAYYLIEINPRVWGGINSAITSGLDIVGLMIDIAKNKTIKPVPYQYGVQTRWFWGDIRIFPDYYKKNNNKMRVITEYLKLFLDKTKTDEFYWDDPLPFFIWPTHVIYKMLRYRTLRPVNYDGLDGEWM